EGNDFAGALSRVKRGVKSGASGEVLGALALVEAESHKWMGNTVEAVTSAVEAKKRLTRGSRRWLTALADLVLLKAKIGDLDQLIPLAEELRGIEPTGPPGP